MSWVHTAFIFYLVHRSGVGAKGARRMAAVLVHAVTARLRALNESIIMVGAAAAMLDASILTFITAYITRTARTIDCAATHPCVCRHRIGRSSHGMRNCAPDCQGYLAARVSVACGFGHG